MRARPILFFILLISFETYARSTTVSLNPLPFRSVPASDLGPLPHEILELVNSGVDTSDMSPVPSKLFKGQKLDLDTFEIPRELSFNYLSKKLSPFGLFRIDVEVNGEFYVLMFDLDNHEHMLRAAILRKLGHDIDMPKYIDELTLSFESKEDRLNFEELLANDTRSNRTRWIIKSSGKKIQLKGALLIPAKLKAPFYFYSIPSTELQSQFRLFRGLLPVYAITQIPENINASETFVSTLNDENLTFNFLNAELFRDVHVDDLKWGIKKLAQLSKEDYLEILQISGYPIELRELLLSYLSLRIKNLASIFDIPYSPLELSQITNQLVQQGKLLVEPKDYLGPLNFFKADPENPFRFNEVYKFFRTQAVTSAVSNALIFAQDRLLPGVTLEEATENVNEKIQNHSSPLKPLKIFTAPMINGKIVGSRNIIFGQFMGSNGTIQLVDSIGVEANIGKIFKFLKKGKNNSLLGRLSGVYSRNYTHIRPMGSLGDATKEKIKKILVPLHMRSLGKSLKFNQKCELEDLFVKEIILFGETSYEIHFDKEIEGILLAVRKKRDEMIQEGIPRGRIILREFKRDEACPRNIQEQKNKNFTDFLESFALNETFIMSDTFKVNAGFSWPQNITTLLSAGLAVNPSAGVGGLVVRSLTLRKKEKLFELTLQRRKDLEADTALGVNYLTEIAKGQGKKVRGKLISEVYKIPIEGVEAEEKERNIKIIQQVFLGFKLGMLKKHIEPIQLDHKVKTGLWSLLSTIFKYERMKLKHELEIEVPDVDSLGFSQSERTKRIFSVNTFKRYGFDPLGFVDRTLKALTVGLLGIGQGAPDPGKTMWGSSKKLYSTVEIELDEDFKPVSKIEWIESYWNLKKKRFNKKIKKLNQKFKISGYPKLYPQGLLSHARQIKSLDLRTTLILYPKALTFLGRLHPKNGLESSQRTLRLLYGEKEFDLYCERAKKFFKARETQAFQYQDQRIQCLPEFFQVFLRNIVKIDQTEDLKEKTRFAEKALRILIKNTQTEKLLSFLPKDTYYLSSLVRGFGLGDAKGYFTIFSNRLGQYNEEYKTGYYDAVASEWDLIPYDLKAMLYTPNF